MGAHSQIDAERQYGGAAFVEDEANEDCPAFLLDEDEAGEETGPIQTPPPTQARVGSQAAAEKRS